MSTSVLAYALNTSRWWCEKNLSCLDVAVWLAKLAGEGAKLPQQTHSLGRAVCGWRHHRFDGANRCRTLGKIAGANGGGRQQSGRRRRLGCSRGRPRRAGRLHLGAGHRVQQRDQSSDQPQSPLRSAQRFFTHRQYGGHAQCAGCQPRIPRQGFCRPAG